MTKREGQVITAITGHLCCSREDFLEYVVDVLGRQVFLEELGSKELLLRIRLHAAKEFAEIMTRLYQPPVVYKPAVIDKAMELVDKWMNELPPVLEESRVCYEAMKAGLKRLREEKW